MSLPEQNVLGKSIQIGIHPYFVELSGGCAFCGSSEPNFSYMVTAGGEQLCGAH